MLHLSYLPQGQEQIAHDQNITCGSCTELTLPLPGPVGKMGTQREVDTAPALKVSWRYRDVRNQLCSNGISIILGIWNKYGREFGDCWQLAGSQGCVYKPLSMEQVGPGGEPVLWHPVCWRQAKVCDGCHVGSLGWRSHECQERREER